MRLLFLDTSNAACAQPGVDPEIFFLSPGNSGHAARKVCNSCPIYDKCLEESLTIPDLQGIWAGKGPRARKELKRSRLAS